MERVADRRSSGAMRTLRHIPDWQPLSSISSARRRNSSYRGTYIRPRHLRRCRCGSCRTCRTGTGRRWSPSLPAPNTSWLLRGRTGPIILISRTIILHCVPFLAISVDARRFLVGLVEPERYDLDGLLGGSIVDIRPLPFWRLVLKQIPMIRWDLPRRFMSLTSQTSCLATNEVERRR